MNDQPPPTPQTKNSLSIISLVLGIISLIPCSIFAGIPAVITGHMAVNRATRSPGEFGGKGMAIAGLVMGYISIAVAMLAIPAAIMLPALAKAKERAQRVACINNLKQIALAGRIYVNDHKEQWPADFLSMSNELTTPKILVCPADKGKTKAVDWASFSEENVSYQFLAPGRDESKPGQPVPMFRCPIHNNVALSDGSAHQLPRNSGPQFQ
jgi:hypothetical protein